NNVGNTQDSQTVFGTDKWVGHVYNWTGGVPPGGTSPNAPSSTTPFANAEYVGYYNIPTETINENFGGSSNCFNVLSDGVNRTTIHTELFSVRYRMKSTRPAGCYFLNVSGDDGVRVYVDNVLVFNQWRQQGTTYYCNNLIYLNGSSDIVLDYYENTGGNTVGFSLSAFDGSTNTISSSADVKVCSGSSPGLIDGSNFGTCSGGSSGGTNSTYQWQVSNDNINFTNISGATGEDYTPAPVTTTTATVINYYRRVLKASATNASSCSFNSSSVKVTTSPSTKTFTTSPATNSCISTDVTYTTQSGMTNYVWTIPGVLGTDYTITTGSTDATSNTVTLKWLTSGSKTVTVNYTSTCSGATAASNTTTFGLLPNNVSSGFSAPTICVGDTPKIIFDADDTGFVGPYTITYKNNASATIYTETINSAAPTSFTPGDNPTSNQTYTLLSIANASCTRTSGFGSAGANLIVRVLPTATISGTTTVCQGSTSPNVTFANPQTAAITVTYNINGGSSATLDVAASGSSTVAVSTTVTGTFTYNLTKVEYKALSTCSSIITGGNVVVTVNSNTVSVASSSPNVCKGSSIIAVTHATTGATGIGTPVNLPPGLVANWSANKVTISGTATTAGTFNYSIPLSGGCGSISAVGTIIVNNTAVVTLVKTDQSCSGLNNGSISTSLSSGLSSIRYIKLTQKYNSWQQVAEIQAFEIFSGANVALATAGAIATSSSNYVNNAATYGPQKAIDGITAGNTFWHSGTSNINEFITVDLSSGKNLDYIRIYNRSDCCQDRGQNMLLELIDGSNTVVYSKTVNLWGGINGANFIDVNVLDVAWTDGATTLNRSGLGLGNYVLNSSDANGCSASTSTTIGTTPIATTYDGLTSTWSPFLPGAGITGTITSSGSISYDVDLCSCTVNAGVTATVASGVMLRLQNELSVIGSGSILFLNNSSLVQINDNAVNSGSIKYDRLTTPISNFDYTYWSSPVTGQKLIDFSPGTLGDKFLSYDSLGNNWVYENAYSNFMLPGVGYIIRGPQSQMAPTPPGPVQYQFSGKPNNGQVSVAVGSAGNSTLLGNPYPSALDADEFIKANAGVIDGTLYFWTHNTSIRLASTLGGTAGSGSYAYTSDDYASYNLTGGVATASKSVSSGFNDYIPSGKIAAGQSFFTSSALAGNVVFNNSMRVGVGSNVGNNSQFFKTASSGKSKAVNEKSRVWLDLYNDDGAYKQTLVGYVSGATNDYDNSFDGETYDSNVFLDFYSINKDKNFAIQGRALPFDVGDQVPIGFRTKIASNYKISIGQIDGLLLEKDILLKDNLLNIVHDLNTGPYSFTTNIGVFDERFVLLYSNKTLGVDDVDPITKGVFISTKDKVITIATGEETIAAAYVYDLAGKQLFAKKAIDTNQMTIANLPATNVVLVVKVVLTNGSVLTQKIVY
ncbi:T9SS sorting signal type C domain-containing protein, partial [Flavobacterium sp.]|uniref:T9SS sorting signal type C domain-containing protein n=1 Tax=Flavobacterium sp. TaxID=239 RepID=UPI002608EF4C